VCVRARARVCVRVCVRVYVCVCVCAEAFFILGLCFIELHVECT